MSPTSIYATMVQRFLINYRGGEMQHSKMTFRPLSYNNLHLNMHLCSNPIVHTILLDIMDFGSSDFFHGYRPRRTCIVTWCVVESKNNHDVPIPFGCSPPSRAYFIVAHKHNGLNNKRPWLGWFVPYGQVRGRTPLRSTTISSWMIHDVVYVMYSTSQFASSARGVEVTSKRSFMVEQC